MRRWPWLVLWLVAAAACHEEGDIEVASLTFEGNEAVASADIASVLATRAGGRLPWSPAAPFNKDEFERDLIRIRQLYEARGYPDATITALGVDLNDHGDEVDLRIGIDEGEPIRVAETRFVGFEALPDTVRERLVAGALGAGDPRDTTRLDAMERQAREAFVNNGYAHAVVTVRADPGASPRDVVVVVSAESGPATVFGDVTVVGADTLGDAVVRRQLTFEPGEMFRQRDVTRSERRLTSLDIVSFADIAATAPPGTERIPVVVTIAEEPARRLELRGGYGTEDRLRGSVEWSHLNFLGDARRLTATTKWSSIDRGVRLAFSQPHVLYAGLSLDASASTWWTSEPIYESDTRGGRIGLTYRVGERGGPGAARSPIDTFRASFVGERISYSVRPEVLEDVTNTETLIALGLDPIDGEGRGTKSAFVLEYERSSTDNVANPRLGYSFSLQFEQAVPAFGGTFDYRKVLGEGRGYVPLGPSVLAGRLRAGSLIAESDADAPFSDRYFLGGSTSLRGWGRYQISPLQDGIPVGGRSLLDASLEWRVPVRDPIGAVFFVDAGNVWAESLDAQASGLRADAGFGLRYGTPIGLIRADMGFQINPVDGLVVNGEPMTRPWRIHLSIGQAF